MSLDRQTVRLVAAMILAIIASVMPSAVQARAGHAHHGQAAQVIPTPVAPPASTVRRAATPVWSGVALAAVATARVEPQRDGCCHPECRARCCGTMTCCAVGILSGTEAVSPSPFRAATVIPRDVIARPGIDPEAVPKPPRTPA